MGLLKGSFSPVCPGSQDCAEWVRVYMKYCLCNVKDGASLTLGVISILSWAVAEVPQILTTFREKSSEGLSLAFLTTWIIGDLFNVFGCMLEPATLPTQFYMALFYTATTVILTTQTSYYRYIYPQKFSKLDLSYKDRKYGQVEKIAHSEQNDTFVYGKERDRKDGNDCCVCSTVEKASPLLSLPIPVSSTAIPISRSPGRDFYYLSARSLSKSHTPPGGSYFLHSRDIEKLHPSSIPRQHSMEEPLLGRFGTMHSEPPSNPKTLFCVVSGLTFFLVNIGLTSANEKQHAISRKSARGIVVQVGRKLLQVTVSSSLLGQEEHGSLPIGSYLGWAMAAIYMGGRLPQIWLNIRRGNVEGLNPFMFAFALVGNMTYVASILLKSLEWPKIQPNLPWLVDAGGCVILDTFILLQFVYFKYRKSKLDYDHGEKFKNSSD